MELIYSLLYMLNEMSPYILLGFLIAGVMHAFISRKTFARHLSGTGFKSVVKAALIGIPLPLCSCGVLPTAIAMRRNGASRAASTSFLIATPQTGVDSIAATWSLLGPAFAVIRPIAALVTALFGGEATGIAERKGILNENENKKKEMLHGQEHRHGKSGGCCDDGCTADLNVTDEPRLSFGRKVLSALKYGYIDLVGSIGGWLVTGLIIAALITVYVPADFFSALGKTPIFSMIAVLIIAIPMYVCATGSIPIALSLMIKGLSPGTALVLLMAGPAANFASFTLISREMGKKSAIIYLTAIIVGSILFGLVIDYLLPAEWFRVVNVDRMACHSHYHFEIFPSICSAIMATLLIITFIRNHRKQKIHSVARVREYKIEGMNCSHCQAAVAEAIKGVDGVKEVSVDLSDGIARVAGDHSPEAVSEAVRKAGFDLKKD